MNPVTKKSQLRNWQDMLLHLRQENALLKMKLSELVDNSVMSDYLSRAEVLNNELILNDNTITLLLTMTDRLYNEADKENRVYDTEMETRQKNLGKDIDKFSKRLRKLSYNLQEDLKQLK